VTPEHDRGLLVVVGTPIGNLGDLTPRAVEALAGADVVYCEDTRRTRGLLTHAGIRGATLRSLHGHNEDSRIAGILDAVRSGRTVALVSDAGMPTVSDPGSALVAAAVDAGLEVSVVPGPSAVTASLVVSGLATGRFCFEGFLPRSGAARRTALASIARETRTAVLFEAPGRLAVTLADLAEACGGDRRVAVVRELTKIHEEVWRGTLADAAAKALEAPVKGEIVVVLAGRDHHRADEEVDDGLLTAALADRFETGARTREAVEEIALDFGVPRRHIYDLALELRRRRSD
jgi:16S rRNA (cytidine1402-2'-O)-methyltransferase